MKRNIEETKMLLQSLVGASIDFDKVLSRFGEIRAALVEIEGERKDINELLQFIDDVARDFAEKRAVMDEVRRKGEMIIWKRQVVSPHLNRAIDELELSAGAADRIPIGVEIVGQLCQYSASELGHPADPYVNEIKDTLRILYAFVLNPEELKVESE